MFNANVQCQVSRCAPARVRLLNAYDFVEMTVVSEYSAVLSMFEGNFYGEFVLRLNRAMQLLNLCKVSYADVVVDDAHSYGIWSEVSG
jgi:hypothetical protein